MQFKKPNIRTHDILFFTACLLCMGAFDIQGAYAPIGWIIGFSLIALSLALPSHTAIAVLLILLGAADISQSTSEMIENGTIVTGSPWQLHLGPIRPGMTMTGVLILFLLKVRRFTLPTFAKPFIFYTLLIGSASSIIYLANHHTPGLITNIIKDSKAAITLSLSLILFYNLFRKFEGSVNDFIKYATLALLARATLYLFEWWIGYGSEFSEGILNRVSVDSTKSTTALVAIIGFYYIAFERKFITGLTLFALGTFLIAIFMTRQNYLNLIFSLLILICMLPMKRAVLASLIGIPAIVLCIVGGTLIAAKLNPEATGLVLARMSRLDAVISLDLQAADPVRYAEFVNVLSSLSTDGTIITGRGFGGSYSADAIPFQGDLTDAFPSYSIESNTYYTVHNVIGQLILKFGVLGTTLWALLFSLPLYRLTKFKPTSTSLRCTRICLLSFSPFAFTSYYNSTKGLIVAAIYLSVAYCITLKRQRQPA